MREGLLLLMIGWLIVGLSIIGYGIYNIVPMSPVLKTLLGIALFFGFGMGYSIAALGFGGLLGKALRALSEGLRTSGGEEGRNTTN